MADGMIFLWIIVGGLLTPVLRKVTGHGGRGRRDGKRWSLKRATIER
jgi:hypothetical protein